MATKKASDGLLTKLSERFHANKHRHPDIEWPMVEAKLVANPAKLASLVEMENSDGEPDVVGHDKPANMFVFMDCAAESPKGRRSLCYDPAALASRKENKPKHSAVGLAAEMGIELLTEEEFRYLQTLGVVDAKTSSWLATPAVMRKLDGALFGDHRFGRVFTYHNGVESYYASRGFRGVLRV